MQKITLVAIDCQEDFLEGGNLAVPGGRQAVKNGANLVNRLGKKITSIYASLDSHQPFQIFHPMFWINKNNEHPNPFTTITHAEVMDGTWRASRRPFQKWVEEYTKTLEDKGRYTHMVWPYHCLLETKGWLLQEDFGNALINWEKENYQRVNFISKGNNPYVENFSAFEAEVPRADDPTTQLNTRLISALEESDWMVWKGLALSHCMKFSMKSVFDNFSNNDYLKKCVLLTDCTAPVTGFEQQADDFVKEMTAKGMQVSTSRDFLA